MGERVLFLSRLEFIVLLLVKGITEIICFPLTNRQNVDEKQMIEAIYELVCMDCLYVDGTLIKLTDSMESIMEIVYKAELCLMIEPGNRSLSQKICYIGDKITVLEDIQEEGKAFRLFSLEKKDFWKWLKDSMNIPEAVIEEKNEAEKLIEFNELALKEKELLTKYVQPEAFQKISKWMEQAEVALEEMPYGSIQCIKKKDQNVQMNMLICQGIMNIWFLWYKPKNDIFQESLNKAGYMHIEPDSVMFRQEILKMLWREEK